MCRLCVADYNVVAGGVREGEGHVCDGQLFEDINQTVMGRKGGGSAKPRGSLREIQSRFVSSQELTAVSAKILRHREANGNTRNISALDSLRPLARNRYSRRFLSTCLVAI